jgi:polyisoprenoid-binding protein YceI
MSASHTLDQITGEYQFDVAHTQLGFVARHAMVTKVRGWFADFEGRAHLDADDPSQSSAEVRIKVASIYTGNEQRDGHLRNSDFLDRDRYPEIVFISTQVATEGKDAYRITGDLTIRGVTRPISVDVTFTGAIQDLDGNLRLGFAGTTTVNRKDWNINWNAALENGGVLVSDRIVLELDISAVKLNAGKPASP